LLLLPVVIVPPLAACLYDKTVELAFVLALVVGKRFTYWPGVADADVVDTTAGRGAALLGYDPYPCPCRLVLVLWCLLL